MEIEHEGDLHRFHQLVPIGVMPGLDPGMTKQGEEMGLGLEC